jgi:hypothetical protein
MAKFYAKDFVITVDGDDLSANIASVELSIEVDDQETTSFGTDGWRTRQGGLKQGSVSLSFHQDFGAGAVDATLQPLIGSVVEVVIKPTSGAVSATNPSYTFDALVNAYVVSGAVGDLATFDVTWPVSGEIVRSAGA